MASVACAEDFARLSPLERLALCTFDNVCSCIRRSVWRVHPFPEAPIAEDVEWAREVLVAGYRLAYVVFRGRRPFSSAFGTLRTRSDLPDPSALPRALRARHRADGASSRPRCPVEPRRSRSLYLRRPHPPASDVDGDGARRRARCRVPAGTISRRPFEPHWPIPAPAGPGVTRCRPCVVPRGRRSRPERPRNADLRGDYCAILPTIIGGNTLWSRNPEKFAAGSLAASSGLAVTGRFPWAGKATFVVA